MPTIESLTADLKRFADERNWGRFHDPKNFAMALNVEAGELLDVFLEKSRGVTFKIDQLKMASEVGDLVINLIQFCRLAEFEVAWLAGKFKEVEPAAAPCDNPLALAMEVLAWSSKLAAPFTWLNRDEAFKVCRDAAMRAEIARALEYTLRYILLFCRDAAIDPLSAAADKLVKLQVRYDAEQQRNSGGFIRQGEDGTVRESVFRD